MTPDRTTMARAAPLLGLVAVLAVTAAVYAPSLQGAFVLDDQESVERNAALRAPDALLLPPLSGMLGPDRPLTQVTYALDLRSAGLDPVRFHAVGLLLHLAATVLAFAFLRRLLGRAGHPRAAGVALAAAAIFALHPIQAESVAYVSQRAEVLSSLLYLASLLLLDVAAARWMDGRGLVAWAGSIGVWVLAMGAKVVAVTQPATFLLDQAIVAPPGEGGARATARRTLRALALAAPILALAAWSATLQFASFAAQPGGGAGFAATKLSAVQYLLTQLRVQWLYLRLLAWPRGFAFDRGFEPSLGPDGAALLAGAGVAALFALALGLWWRAGRGEGEGAWERPAAFGILFWFVVLSPTSSFVPLLDLAVEHRVYLAALGPILAGTVAVDALLRRGLGARAPRAAVGLLVLVVAVLGISTFGRARTWGSTVDLLRESSAANPDSVRIRVNLAIALQRTGNLAAAEVELRAAAPLAHTVTAVVDVATNLGALLIDTGRAAEAIPVLDQGLRASPQETILLVNRSAALRILGRHREAVEDGRRAVALRPDDPYTRSILGMALLATGDLEGGLAEVRAAGALDPGNPEFPITEAIALARAGRRDEACTTLRRARATTHVLPMPRNAVRAAAQLGCPIE